MQKTIGLALALFVTLSGARASELRKTFEVRTTLIGFTTEEEKKITAASELIRTIVRSAEFKDKVLGHTWNGKKTFAENKGLSNEKIYQKILEGAERQTRLGKNNTMDLEIELYHDPDSITIGYTYPSIVRIFMNRKYFDKFRPYQVTDNMVHEWLHKIGFTHAVKNTPERPYTVPYAVGYIVKRIARRLENSRPLIADESGSVH